MTKSHAPTAYVSSIDLANTVLKEHLRFGHTPTVTELLAQTYAVEKLHLQEQGSSITGDEYTDRADGLGFTTGSLRAKFQMIETHQAVTRMIPVADGSAFTIPNWTIRRIIRRVLKAKV